MNNQVIFYDRMNDTVKLIDGIKSISLNKAKRMGFTPNYLIQMAGGLLALNKDAASQKALRATKEARNQCPVSQYDNVSTIISYDRMSDKVKIFGGAITIPFKIALHKGVTPAHLMRMACQLLSDGHEPKSTLTLAKKAYEACKLAQVNQPQYKNKRYK